jgi:hypothetical protein
LLIHVQLNTYPVLRENKPNAVRSGASTHTYEVRPRRDKRGFDLISDVLPFGELWYGERNAIGYAEHFSRSHDAVIWVYDVAGNVIKTHEQRAISRSGECYRPGKQKPPCGEARRLIAAVG